MKKARTSKRKTGHQHYPPPMNGHKPSKIERLLAAHLPGIDLTKPAHTSLVRDWLAMSAYHEAGHVAADAFTWNRIGHIQSVSVLPDETTLARVIYDTPIPADIQGLARLPEPFERCLGRKILLSLFAGSLAQLRPLRSVYRTLLRNHAGGEQDVKRAREVAEIMVGPGGPAKRVLALTEKWTAEMLALPDVWRCVRTLARVLFERGTIEDRDEIMAACEGILGMGLKLPKWKRRLCPTRAELEQMTKRG
jgi:hypothetical protein